MWFIINSHQIVLMSQDSKWEVCDDIQVVCHPIVASIPTPIANMFGVWTSIAKSHNIQT